MESPLPPYTPKISVNGQDKKCMVSGVFPTFFDTLWSFAHTFCDSFHEYLFQEKGQHKFLRDINLKNRRQEFVHLVLDYHSLQLNT